MPEVLTPNCPLCGHPPLFTIGTTQALCGNRDGCNLIMWDPTQSLDANLTDAGMVHFPAEGAVHDE
jgi:hypothetical protein